MVLASQSPASFSRQLHAQAPATLKQGTAGKRLLASLTRLLATTKDETEQTTRFHQTPTRELFTRERPVSDKARPEYFLRGAPSAERIISQKRNAMPAVKTVPGVRKPFSKNSRSNKFSTFP
jgi:hypothetical protein